MGLTRHPVELLADLKQEPLGFSSAWVGAFACFLVRSFAHLPARPLVQAPPIPDQRTVSLCVLVDSSI